MNKLNFAIVGCGRISYKHVEAIIDNYENCQLIAVCDVIEERARAKAQEYVQKSTIKNLITDFPKVYTDYKEMISKENIDVVTVATESGKHAQIAIDVMNNKINVIVEKPMAMTLEDADKMIEISKNNDVKLCISHQNRFNPAVQKLRKAIEENRFGKIFAGSARILWNRNRDYYNQAKWRGTKEQDGGCLMNQCIHNIDLLQWMLGGKVKELHSMLSNYTHPYIQMEDYGSIQIRFENGAIGNVEGTVSVYPSNLEETLTILGENGTVVIGGKAVNEIYQWRFADNKETIEEVKKECNQEIESVYGWGHSLLFKDVIESIIDNRKPYISGEDGRIALDIILKSYSI